MLKLVAFPMIMSAAIIIAAQTAVSVTANG
jgi:hypothetical protein